MLGQTTLLRHTELVMKNRTTEYQWLMMLLTANIKNKTIHQEMIQELEEFAMKKQEVAKP